MMRTAIQFFTGCPHEFFPHLVLHNKRWLL